MKLQGKTGRREVPIPDDLAEILGNLPIPLRDPEKYCVFTYRNKPITDIRTGLKKACEKAEITFGVKVEDGFVFSLGICGGRQKLTWPVLALTKFTETPYWGMCPRIWTPYTLSLT
jgi:hypothetical protein